LLGTWHGEGWTPPSGSNMGSTLLQVLVSIQSIIMVSKPYFNEPGYADEEGTPAGEQRSREYNEHIRLAAMRHAMRDMLRRPPRGFEEVVRRHFVLNRPLLERQCAAWLGECVAPQNRVAMEKAYVEIVELIEVAEKKLAAGEGSEGGEGVGADAGSSGSTLDAPVAAAAAPNEETRSAPNEETRSAPNEVTMAEAPPATPVAPTPPPPAAPVSAPLSPAAAAFQARVHELFAQNVALGQERNAAAAAALQQAQAEQGSLASSPGTASSKDVEMA
jgi:hypothetical protein